MDIASRLTIFREYTGLSHSRFSDITEISRPTLSQFLNGRNKRLSDELASKIHRAFPNLNMMWLLFGEGEMLLDSNIEFSEGKIPENSPNNHIQDIDRTTVSIDNDIKKANQNSDSTGKTYSLFSDEVDENDKKDVINTKNKGYETQIKVSSSKTVNHIMVFYTDNSYEEFRPVGR